MKKMKTFAALLTMICLSGLAHAAAPRCIDVIAGSTLADSQLGWRADRSHALDGKILAGATIKTREKKLATIEAEAVQDINDGVTPLMETLPEAGVKWSYLLESSGYGSGEINKIEVKGIKDGVLRATMALSVSGHVGLDNAKKWAQTDMYNVYIQNPGESEKILVRAKSLGFVTFQEVQIPLIKGQTVTVSYARDGSAGPGGYSEGRTLEIFWDGK